MINGTIPNEGFVEIKGYNGTWGGICDDDWDKPDADVVCRMLGYPASETVYRQSYPFGHGTGSLILDDVNCVGHEKSVFDCQHNRGVHNCGAAEWAGVKCKISNSKIHYNLKKDSLLHNGFVSEEEQNIQKPVDLNKPLTKEMEKAVAQKKGDLGEITDENHEKDKKKSDSVSKEGEISRSVLKVNFPYLVT